jgi:WD40 repeat protein
VSNASLLILDAASGDELTAIEGMPFGARTLCFSDDGKRLACGFRDGTALVWNLRIPEKAK